jgi:hypothetical protein
MIDDIDTPYQILTLIEISGKFAFWDNAIWLNRSEPGLTGLEDIDILQIRQQWESDRFHCLFVSFHDIVIAIILDHPDSLSHIPRFDARSPRYFGKLKVSDFWSESISQQDLLLGTHKEYGPVIFRRNELTGR